MPLYKLVTLPKIAKSTQHRLPEKTTRSECQSQAQYRDFPIVTTIYFSILSPTVHEGLKLELQTIPDMNSEGKNLGKFYL